MSYYDALETRDPAQREAALMAALRRQVEQARSRTAAFGELLAGVEPRDVRSREALAKLPVTRKHELLQRQQAQRASTPFGGFAAVGWQGLNPPRGAKRVFQSPGTIYEPEGEAPDYWRAARAIYAAGFRPGDLVHNSFSYHLTPAGAIMESGAHAVGCTVFPGGVGNTELQLQAMSELRPHGYIGTPSFLKILIEKAEQQDLPLPGMKKALLSGEAFPPSLRLWLQQRGVEGYQCYATADVGLIAYETEAREGLVLDEGVIVEIVRPGTGDPVPEGEVGEVVVTALNPDYPLIRFGTGDLSAMLPGQCPTGRTNARIKGWMGRADQTAKVRGMFVHPGQVADVVKRHADVQRARLVVSGEMASDVLTLHAEVAQELDGLAERLAQTVRDITKLRADIRLCSPGSLPNDGKVIEDLRRYD
jgi:phenylacetate-CoA ligase